MYLLVCARDGDIGIGVGIGVASGRGKANHGEKREELKSHVVCRSEGSDEQSGNIVAPKHATCTLNTHWEALTKLSIYLATFFLLTP